MTEQQILAAAVLWRQGKDTKDISQNLNLPESDVYGRLPVIKRIARQAA
jgi:hypothetical protein